MKGSEIVKLKIPDALLVGCNYDYVKLDSSNIKKAIIELTEYSLELQKEIDRCNDDIQDIRALNNQ